MIPAAIVYALLDDRQRAALNSAHATRRTIRDIEPARPRHRLRRGRTGPEATQ